MKVGYIRVSAKDQNPERQLADIELDKKFTEYASAKDTARPELQSMMTFLREGDELWVHSLDRLARNLYDLQSLVKKLVEKGVKIHFVKEGLAFSNQHDPIAYLTLSIMGSFAEFERAILRERQKEGIAIAKARGKYKRKKKLKDEEIENMKNLLRRGASKSRVARMFNISMKTVYKYLGGEKIDPLSILDDLPNVLNRCSQVLIK
jgi:DNA invertase Pin-like site-specific DNA recombinase